MRTWFHWFADGSRFAAVKCWLSFGYAPVQVLKLNPLLPEICGFSAQYRPAQALQPSTRLSEHRTKVHCMIQHAGVPKCTSQAMSSRVAG